MKRIVFLMLLGSLNMVALSPEQKAKKEKTFLQTVLLLQGKTPLYKSSYFYKNVGQGAGYGALAGGIAGASVAPGTMTRAIKKRYPKAPLIEAMKVAAPSTVGYYPEIRNARSVSYKFEPAVARFSASFTTVGAALGAATGASIAALGATAYFFYVPRQIDVVLAKYMPNTTFKSLSPYAAMLCYAAYKRDFGMMRVALQHDDAQAFFNQPGAWQAVADLAKLSKDEFWYRDLASPVSIGHRQNPS